MAGRLALSVAALALTLGAMELALRPFYPPTSLPYEHRIPHPILGWSLEPNADFVYENIGFRIELSYNARGWRDLPRRFEKPEGVFRIVVLGDSFMEAYCVVLEEAFHLQLEKRLAAAGKRVEVLNLGVGGYGTLQEYLALRMEGMRYDPDLVVLAFNLGNDLSNNSKYLGSLFFRRGHIKVAARPYLEPGTEWTVSPPDYERALSVYRYELRGEKERPWWRRTSLARLAEKAELDRWWSRFWEEGSPSRRSRPETVECDGQPRYEEGWRITERILARTRDLAASGGAPLLVFTVPKEQGRQRVRLRLRWSQGDKLRCRDDDPVARLARIAERQDIPFVDLGPAFEDAWRDDGASFIRKGDGHWNAVGHRLAARRVASALEERGLLPE